MLPASNRGAGQSLNFPDVCKTPAPPLPFVPVPYPDLGMNMQAAPFSPFVSIAFVPATNMGSLKVMTSGDEIGSMGGLITGLIKGPGKTTMGNPLVFVTGLPAESLLNPTSGNTMNAPIGAQIVPSVVNVLYTYLPAPGEVVVHVEGAPAAEWPLTVGDLMALRDVACGEGEAEDAARIRCQWLRPGVASVRIGLFSGHADRELGNALRELGEEAVRAVVLDLRGNRGGDAGAALRLAAAWLPRGTTLLLERDADGDDEPVIARGEQAYSWPLCVLIDGGSASASELVAAALQFHHRAVVIGERSFGKASAQGAVPRAGGGLRYATVAEYRLPDGTPLQGRGVTPDVAALRVSVGAIEAPPSDLAEWEKDAGLRAALEVLHRT